MESGHSREGRHVPGDEPDVESSPQTSPQTSTQTSPGTSPQPDHASHGSGRRVLVCDDTEQIRQLIRVNLELDGYQVVEAVDGVEAMELLQDVTQPLPDLITLDVLMPRRDGWWTVSTIRADPRLAHIPIVMVTASAQETDRRQAKRACVDDFLAKPFDPDELLSKILALADVRHV